MQFYQVIRWGGILLYNGGYACGGVVERLKRLAAGMAVVLLGGVIGLALIELMLHLNPQLLLRGMAALAPVDPPVTTRVYDVYTSDADLFIWQPRQIRPIPESERQLEAHVTFYTDELGFPNPAPLPPRVDVVVLGRSYSMGAQAEAPWPRLLEQDYGLRALNLSQSGSDQSLKLEYLLRYGLPRSPRWVIVEILPSMDILPYEEQDVWLAPDLPQPLAQSLLRRWLIDESQGGEGESSNYIYPMELDLPENRAALTFFNHYLEALSLDTRQLSASLQWQAFRASLMDMVEAARREGACVAMLYVPTKENIYLPMALDANQAAPAFEGLTAWGLGSDDSLQAQAGRRVDPLDAARNAHAARDLLKEFAERQNLAFIDPTDCFQASISQGLQPFMRYDTHWSALGHRLIADLIMDTLDHSPCP